MYDVIIKDGLIVDGKGEPGFVGSIGVTGDTIELLPPFIESPECGRLIDAKGKVVCPGFIDMHSHSELSLLTDPHHEPKVRQGVTTEAIGMDGLSYAPCSDANRLDLIKYLIALNGEIPETFGWSTVGEFLDLFVNTSSCNVAYFVPHISVRVEAMGWEARLPNESELKRMGDLVKQGMADGAFGFSTGLTYTPGAYSDTNELIHLAKAAGEYGGIYMTHSRYTLGDRLLDPFREAIKVGKDAGVPVHISHFHSPVNGLGSEMIKLVDSALSDDVEVTFDQYPYPAASTILHSLLPYWVHAGGMDQLYKRIMDPGQREEIGEAINPQWGGQTLDNYIFSHIGSAENQDWIGKSITDLANFKNMSVVDAVCELLVQERLNVGFVARTGNEGNIRQILLHDSQMVGSDGVMQGGQPNPRTYGTFPYVLGKFVREENLLSLPKAISKMSYGPACRLGLKDRGSLSNGMKADIVIFDEAEVGTEATFDNPKIYPSGIEYVLVNGEIVIDNYEHTGRTPGTALRSR